MMQMQAFTISTKNTTVLMEKAYVNCPVVASLVPERYVNKDKDDMEMGAINMNIANCDLPPCPSAAKGGAMPKEQAVNTGDYRHHLATSRIRSREAVATADAPLTVGT